MDTLYIWIQFCPKFSELPYFYAYFKHYGLLDNIRSSPVKNCACTLTYLHFIVVYLCHYLLCEMSTVIIATTDSAIIGLILQQWNTYRVQEVYYVY